MAFSTASFPSKIILLMKVLIELDCIGINDNCNVKNGTIHIRLMVMVDLSSEVPSPRWIELDFYS